MNIPLYVIYVHCSPLSNNMKTSFRSERKSLESGQLSCNWLVYQQGTNGDPRFNLLLQCRSVTSDRLSQIITTERPLSSYWKKKYILGLLITNGELYLRKRNISFMNPQILHDFLSWHPLFRFKSWLIDDGMLRVLIISSHQVNVDDEIMLFLDASIWSFYFPDLYWGHRGSRIC